MLGIPADNDLSAVKRLQPGGVILMGRNAGSRADVRRLTRAIAKECEQAPLIATDQEGGRVQRLLDGFTRIPTMRELGERGANAVSLMAMNVAAELRAVGVNVNFAPVCDVPTHAEDTVIGARAFSDNPIRAGLLAAEYVRGAQPTVMCVAKHFPGHGGVGVDSHEGLPTDDSELSTLKAQHFLPFGAAIGAGVGGVMMGHLVFPALDETNAPASLSQPIVTGVLREQLRFRGVVFTDDLEMKALSQTPEEIGVQAIAAGCDQLLWCHSSEKAERSLDAIEKALSDGDLDAVRVRDAIERVQWAKRKFGVLEV